MKHVLISGASVAGPALAYWLNRHGMRVTVVERAPAVRPGGLAVDFRGTAMRVLDRMGILDELRAHATRMGDATVVDEDGTPIATMPGEIFSGDLEVLKSDLTRVLYDLTKNDVEYVFSDSITALTQDADGVRVEFEHGTPRRFDLVVGADGLHSRVRALAFGPKDRFTHDMGFAFATFSTENFLNLNYSGLSHVAGDRSVNVFATKHNTEARVMFMFPATADVPRTREAQQEAVRSAFAGVGWQAQNLLATMPAAPDFYYDELSQITMPTWSAGRVALVGDAACCASPMSGRGTSQALLGAYVLAGELSTQDHGPAFEAYEKVLRDYVAANQAMGRQARDLFGLTPTQEMFDALAAADTEEDSPDNVDLPDYTKI